MEQIVFTYMMQFACHTADGPMDSVTAPSCKRTWALAYQSKGILRICIIPSNKSLIISINRSTNYYPSTVSGEVQLAASACHNTWSNKWLYYFTTAWFTKWLLYLRIYKISPSGWIRIRTLGTVTNWKLASLAFGKKTSGFQMALTKFGSERSSGSFIFSWANRWSYHRCRKYVSVT